MQRVIRTVIPSAPPLPRLLRAAAYARVSSGKDAMLHSLSSQVSHYNNYIQQHKDWTFAGVFVDEALTGTKDTRQGFQDLLTACRAGEIDIVITKSISRFARNTVTLLEVVRELKELGIDVYFERENIHSISEDGELMLTILASYAQEESLSASENCKWRIRSMFAEGRPNNGTILGYRLVAGVYYVMPQEAKVVRMVFRLFLEGMGRMAIANLLNALGYQTRLGGLFNQSGIATILRNEKYTGDMVLQKTFTLDHISKKKCKNNGELPQYLVSQSHEAIVDRENFAAVQHELAVRAEKHHPSQSTPNRYPFSGVIRCGICGSYFRRKHANAGGKYEKIVWICNTFNTKGKAVCPSRQIPEDILEDITASVMGLPAFDSLAFATLIDEIQVPAVDRLVFVFRDGREVECEWQNPSRSLSWDVQARKRQGELMRRLNHT